MAGFGTYRATATGAVFTSGGKKNRQILFEVSAAEIERFAKRCKDQFKTMVAKAEGRAASGCRAQVRKAMKVGGGVYGIPKFKEYDPFTLVLHKGWANRRIGGILADSWSIVMYKRGGVQYVGWPNTRRGKDGKNTLADLSCKFQEGRGGPDAEKWFNDNGYRHSLHVKGIKDIPRAYVHNPRQVLSRYAERLDANLSDFKRGVLNKMIATEIYKAARASKGAA